MTYPSHLERDALRRALRAHPDHARVIGDRRINNLRRQDLEKALLALGLDPVAIASSSAPAPGPNPARDNPPLPQTEEASAMPDKTGELRAGLIALGVNPETATSNASVFADGRDLADLEAVDAEVQTLRGLIADGFRQGNFSTLDEKLGDLVREARKPAVEVEVIREVQVIVEAVPGQAVPVHKAQMTGATGTWGNLFGVRGSLARRTCQMWDGSHPSTPTVDPQYVWPQPETAVALTQIARKRNVWLFGPKGTGKTEFAIQLAARLGRPFALISCDESTDAPTLLGMTVPTQEGGVTFQDGVLPKAIRTPGCVVLIDEPSTARAGALMVFQNVLEKRFLTLGENGARVNMAPGVTFIAADNTNGTGGGGRHGYTGTNRVNGATLDRFGVAIDFNYLPRAQEEGVLVARTGCTPELAALLVNGAALTRAAADNQTLSHGLGLRPLIAWAELLTDGIPADVAFKCAVLNKAPETDRETLREQLLLTYDKATVAAALTPSPMVVPGAVVNDPTLTNPTAAGRNAAADFERN